MQRAAVWLILAGGLNGETRGRAGFEPPAGWTAETAATFSTFRRIQGNTFCQISIYDPQSGGATLAASFAAEWGGIFGQNFRPAPPPRATEKRTEAGYRYADGEGEVEDLRGNRFFAKLAAFEIEGGAQSVVGVATNRSSLEGCGAEWTAFLRSIRFPGGAEKPATPSAGPGAFGSLRYAAPAGWVIAAGPSSVRFTPTTLQPGEDLALVLLPSRPEGPLDQAFSATFAEIVTRHGGAPLRRVSGQVFDLEEVRRTAGGVEYLTGSGGMSVNGRAYTIRPYLYHATGRVERVCVLSADFRAELVTVTTLSNPRFERDVHRFLSSLRFSGIPDPPARAATAEGPGPTGVWGGSAMSFGTLKAHLLALLSDGSAYFGPRFPAQGLAGIDPAAEREAAPRDWGRWSFQNGAGEIRMPYGSIPLRMDGPVLVVTTSNTPHRFVRLPSLTAAQVAGNWCFEDGPCLALRPDGRFRDGGAARMIEHATYPYPESPEGGSGIFDPHGHTLRLRYEGGREFRIALPGLMDSGGAGRAPRLWLGAWLDILTQR